ncbi:MAG: hypothetical protein ACTHK0_15535 [Ginsengibacter sp.]
MKKATKRSVIMACVFVLISAINLLIEYKKSSPSGLVLKWIMLTAFIIFALLAFIRYNNQKMKEVDNRK